jgi:hypothetical protein
MKINDLIIFLSLFSFFVHIQYIMTTLTINSIDQWRQNIIYDDSITTLCFRGLEESLSINSIPRNVTTIEISRSPNLIFIGSVDKYTSVIDLFLYQLVPNQALPNVIMQMKPLNLTLEYEYGTPRSSQHTLRKEDCIIPFHMETLLIDGCKFTATSLSNVQSVTSLGVSNSADDIIPILPPNVTELRISMFASIIFSGELPLQLDYIDYFNPLENINEEARAKICNLDLRRRMERLPDLVFTVELTQVPTSEVCPKSYYRDVNTRNRNISRIAMKNQIPYDATAHVQSYLLGGRRYKPKSTRNRRRHGKKRRGTGKARANRRTRRN